ncbi:MAG: response regulator [Candidatus Omnitrophota bacterium]|nr:response regulator [Candidatus Omnitrophota bacterium]
MDTQKKNLKLLIVDDTDDVCEFMQSYFRRRGFDVFAAGSAEDAIPIIREQSPDIMVLDMNLPGMSGPDMLKSVRQFNQAVKVIMITGYDLDLQSDPEFQKLNVFDVMHKPVTADALNANIEKLLK